MRCRVAPAESSRRPARRRSPRRRPAAQLFDNIDVAFVVGLLVSAVVYLLLNRGVERSQEERAVALSGDALKAT